MKRRNLGRSRIAVSEIGLDAGNLAGPSDAASIVAAALEEGVNLFGAGGDLAAEKKLGACLKGKSDLVVSSTIGVPNPNSASMDFSAAHLQAALEGSLKRLQREQIDIGTLYFPPAEALIPGAVTEFLQKQKIAGKLRLVAVWPFSLDDALLAVRSGGWDVIHVTYNVFESEAALELFPQAERAGVGIVVQQPLSRGVLAGRPDAPTAAFETGQAHRLPTAVLESRQKVVDSLLRRFPQYEEAIAALALQFCLHPTAVSSVMVRSESAAEIERMSKVSGMPRLESKKIEQIERIALGLEANR